MSMCWASPAASRPRSFEVPPLPLIATSSPTFVTREPISAFSGVTCASGAAAAAPLAPPPPSGLGLRAGRAPPGVQLLYLRIRPGGGPLRADVPRRVAKLLEV